MNIENFLKTYDWYRNLSLELLNEFPVEQLNYQISDRSCTARFQYIDLGITQLKITGMICKQDLLADLTIPNGETASKEEITEFLKLCNEKMKSALTNENTTLNELDWFGRFMFDIHGSITFLLAHEAMHHGEILSLIYAKNLPMPQAFKKTWGFEL